MQDTSRGPSIDLSIIAPAHNEQDNVAPLVREITEAVDPLKLRYEIIVVDDGSTDRTHERLVELRVEHDVLRVLRMANTPPSRGNGQSAAFHAGFRAARGALIATLDADLQNDPSDIPMLIRALHQHCADMAQGNRQAARADGVRRRIGFWVGRLFRRVLLGDTIIDTGCSLRVMKREVALRLPLEFRGMHRFIPVTARRLGYNVIELPVSHRVRISGVAKYGLWNRAIPGIPDCLAVRWMNKRRMPTAFHETKLENSSKAACDLIHVKGLAHR
jgi:dolichol-phosphate mannosyltransferase